MTTGFIRRRKIREEREAFAAKVVAAIPVMEEARLHEFVNLLDNASNKLAMEESRFSKELMYPKWRDADKDSNIFKPSERGLFAICDKIYAR